MSDTNKTDFTDIGHMINAEAAIHYGVDMHRNGENDEPIEGFRSWLEKFNEKNNTKYVITSPTDKTDKTDIIRKILFDIEQQATRKDRASKAEHLVINDLDIIKKLAISGQSKFGKTDKTSWTDTFKEQPPCYYDGDWDGKRSDPVLIKDKYDVCYIARRYHGILDGNVFSNYETEDGTNVGDVVGWMEIPV